MTILVGSSPFALTHPRELSVFAHPLNLGHAWGEDYSVQSAHRLEPK